MSKYTENYVMYRNLIKKTRRSRDPTFIADLSSETKPTDA